MDTMLRSNARGALAVVLLATALAGCDTLSGISPTKRIDYKSVSSTP